MDCRLSDSPVHTRMNTRILEWVAISFSRGSSRPRDWIWVSFIGRWILYLWATWKPNTTDRKNTANLNFVNQVETGKLMFFQNCSKSITMHWNLEWGWPIWVIQGHINSEMITGFGSRQPWIQTLLADCVALGQSYKFPEPHFPNL